MQCASWREAWCADSTKRCWILVTARVSRPTVARCLVLGNKLAWWRCAVQDLRHESTPRDQHGAWCDSRSGMILDVGVLDDGHGKNGGYGILSVSRGAAAAQEQVKERRDAARAVQGRHYWLEARREGQWLCSSAGAARRKRSGSWMGMRLGPTAWD